MHYHGLVGLRKMSWNTLSRGEIVAPTWDPVARFWAPGFKLVLVNTDLVVDRWAIWIISLRPG